MPLHRIGSVLVGLHEVPSISALNQTYDASFEGAEGDPQVFQPHIEPSFFAFWWAGAYGSKATVPGLEADLAQLEPICEFLAGNSSFRRREELQRLQFCEGRRFELVLLRQSCRQDL